MQSELRMVLVFTAGLACGGALKAPLVLAARANLQAPPSAGSNEVAVLRLFKIKKGTFDEFYRASAEKVWPYYEKTGARIVGMWQVAYPTMPGQTRKESPDYDEAYSLTRYVNFAHWETTRNNEISKLGGDGPDFATLQEGLRIRAGLGIPQGPGGEITVLRGRPAFNGPYFPKPIQPKQ
jgi:hypothetical protein